MVNVPVVSASRFESDIGNSNGFARLRYRIQEGIADEVFGVGGVRLSLSKNVLLVEFRPVCHLIVFFVLIFGFFKGLCRFLNPAKSV